MRIRFAAAFAAAVVLQGCDQQTVPPPKAEVVNAVMTSVTPNKMAALLKSRNFVVVDTGGEAQAPILYVNWPKKESGAFEVHFSNCKPAQTLGDTPCSVVGYAAWNEGVMLTPEQVNDVNATILLGRAFSLPEGGSRLKKGTTVFVFTVPLYGGVTENYLRESAGGWAQVLQGFIDLLRSRNYIAADAVPAPAEVNPAAQ